MMNKTKIIPYLPLLFLAGLSFLTLFGRLNTPYNQAQTPLKVEAKPRRPSASTPTPRPTIQPPQKVYSLDTLKITQVDPEKLEDLHVLFSGENAYSGEVIPVRSHPFQEAPILKSFGSGTEVFLLERQTFNEGRAWSEVAPPIGYTDPQTGKSGPLRGWVPTENIDYRTNLGGNATVDILPRPLNNEKEIQNFAREAVAYHYERVAKYGRFSLDLNKRLRSARVIFAQKDPSLYIVRLDLNISEKETTYARFFTPGQNTVVICLKVHGEYIFAYPGSARPIPQETLTKTLTERLSECHDAENWTYYNSLSRLHQKTTSKHNTN